MTVGEMLQRMSSSEITEWRGYFSIKASEQAARSGNTSGLL